MDKNFKIDNYFEYEKQKYGYSDFVGNPRGDETIIDEDNEIFKDAKAIRSTQFSGATSFYEMYLPENIEYVGQSGLSSTVIAKFSAAGLKILGRYALANCEYLESVALPNTLEYIGKHAFKKCMYLQKIVLPPSVKYLPEAKDSPLLGCCSLKEITCNQCLKDTIISYSADLAGLSKIHLTDDDGKIVENLMTIAGRGIADRRNIRNFKKSNIILGE